REGSECLNDASALGSASASHESCAATVRATLWAFLDGRLTLALQLELEGCRQIARAFAEGQAADFAIVLIEKVNNLRRVVLADLTQRPADCFADEELRFRQQCAEGCPRTFLLKLPLACR